MKSLRLDVWSDIVCPWCYIGKRRLEAALALFPHRDAIELVWRAFELDPGAPRTRDTDTNGSYAQRLATKYNTSIAQAETQLRRMTDLAAAEGLDFRFDRIKPGNTFDAHRVLHFAATRGVQNEVKERLLRGYMTEGEPIGDPGVVARLAGEAGLELEAVRAVLAGDDYARDVRADEQEARELGVTGVPFFVFGRKYAVSGAQPPEVHLRALERAWRELAAAGPEPVLAEGAMCGPDGCD
ncbi:MAG: DsbA family oxidoreductase [Polyangiaceae bacterium]